MDWDALDECEEADEMAGDDGRAARKIRCVADHTSGETLVATCADEAIGTTIAGRRDAFVNGTSGVAEWYSCQVVDGHRLTVDLFGGHRHPGL